VTCISAGMDEAAIMKKFNLSAKALYSLYDQLVDAGKLTQSQLDRRPCLSPGTVVIDLNKPEFPTADTDKPVIKAADAVKYIRSGMDDSSLMKRYKISAKGLQSLFRKLVAAGVLDQSELNRRLSETHAWAILEEEDLQAHERKSPQTEYAPL
jgi:predicted transcriptional regulator